MVPRALATAALGVVLLLSLTPTPSLAEKSAFAELVASPAFSLPAERLLAAALETPAPPEAQVEILLEEVVYDYDQHGRQTFRHRLVYRVLTAEAVDGWANSSEAWSPWRQERPELRARVVTRAGKEYRLDQATITEAPVGDESSQMLSDRLQLLAALPAVEVGSVIEEEHVVRDSASLLDRGNNGTFFFQWQVPVRHLRLVLAAPTSLPLRYRTYALPDFEPRRETTTAGSRWTFERGPLPAFEGEEPFLPPDVTTWPQVRFSTGASWQDLATAYAEVVDRQIANAKLGKLVRPALEKTKTRQQTIDCLVALLHENVRYTGVELGEAAIVPRTPAETLERRYGDCKDKSALLVALLREAGIEARVALLRTTGSLDSSPELPGLGIFDHAIVHVPGDPEVWIDATADRNRAGELPPMDQGRLALVAAPTTTELVRLPEAPASANRSRLERDVWLAELGYGNVHEVSTYSGIFEAYYRDAFAGLDRTKWSEAIVENFSAGVADTTVEKLELTPVDDLATPLRLELEAQRAGFAHTDLAAALTYLPATSDFFEDLPEDLLQEPEGEKRRQRDLLLPFSYSVEHRYNVHPPDGYRPVEVPESKTETWGPATFVREVEQAPDGTVTVSLRFDTGKRRLSPAEAEALGQGVRAAAAEGRLAIQFENVGQSHLAAGDVRQALAEFRRLAARQPESGLPRIRIASALLTAGLGEAARREARAAVELDGGLDLTHQSLAVVLTHDLLGRQFSRGFDHAGAKSALDKAIEIRHENEQSWLNQAILLEHDAAGWRYSSAADLEGAAAAYRKAKELGSGLSKDVEANFLILLARAGRCTEVPEAAATVEPTTRISVEVFCKGWEKGVEAAIKEARLKAPAGQLQTILSAAADYFMYHRRYQDAASLLAAAASSNTTANTTDLLARVEHLRKVRPFEPGAWPEGSPERFFSEFVLAQVRSDRETLRRAYSRRMHFSARQLEDQITKAIDSTSKAVESVRLKAGRLENLEDALAVGFEFHSEGEPEHGFRLLVSYVALEPDTFFLVHEDDGFKFLTDESPDMSPLGVMALEHLEAGDLEGARRWLDWARRDVEARIGEDPLSGSPFARLWEEGSVADTPSVRLAASALMADGWNSGRALDLLSSLDTTELAAGQREALELAQVNALLKLGRHAEALPMLERMHATHPTSKNAFRARCQSLRGLGRHDEISGLALARLESQPHDQIALECLMLTEADQGNLERAVGYGEQLIRAGHATATTYNNLAWYQVAMGAVSEKTLEHAQKSVQMSANASAASLHTLAAVYAELGRTNEARAVLLQYAEVDEQGNPDDADWWVIGRMAETFGELDAARDAYSRIARDPDEISQSTSVYTLAQRRLKLLAGGEANKSGKG